MFSSSLFTQTSSMYPSLILLPPKCPLHPSLLAFVFSQFCPLQSNSCLMNGELMPEVRRAQLTTELTEMPAVCLFALGLKPANHTHTHTHKAFISLCAGHLYGNGTCVGKDMGQSASNTTRRWAFWSIGKYIHHGWLAQSNIFQRKCI